jgi:hypothetical protein
MPRLRRDVSARAHHVVDLMAEPMQPSCPDCRGRGRVFGGSAMGWVPCARCQPGADQLATGGVIDKPIAFVHDDAHVLPLPERQS